MPSPFQGRKNWLNQGLHSAAPLIAICLLVFAGVVLLWRTGHLQFAEFLAYDRYIKANGPSPNDDSPVVVIGITEEDLHRLGTYPIPDDALADALRNVLQAEPAAVVVDIYRDLPVAGKDPSGLARLAALFKEHPHLIAIQRLGLGNDPAVRPPPFLAGQPEQIGFNDFSILDQDIDDSVRRATLMMWEFGDVFYSDPLLATLIYLEKHGIDYDISGSASKEVRLGQSWIRRFERNQGAYVNADTSGYQILLGFHGPEKYRTYSFTEAREGTFPGPSLRGKVVLVGPLADSLKDFVDTPLKSRHPGLLMHAQIVDQLVALATGHETQMRAWTEWQETFWILGWCAAGTLAGFRARSPVVLAGSFFGGLGLLVGAFLLGMQANLWLLLAAPVAGFTFTTALSVAHQTYLERRQRAVLMNLFAQHVSPEIAADIWKHRDEFMDGQRPKPQVIEGTVFFTDLKGFTTTAEAMPPESLIHWLNDYMGAMAGLIEKHGGMVNKYMGDAIMAAFGAPVPRTTEEEYKRDATNAALCALEMARRLDHLNADWEKRGLPTTTMRIGIASGPLLSGSIGGSGRLEYTVTGDTVVTAKRLESAGKDAASLEMASNSCRILMSAQTHAMIGPQFQARPLGQMHLEGKRRAVEAYVLIGFNEGLPE